MFDYNEKYGKLPDNELFLVAGYDSASVLLNAFKGCDAKDVDCVKRGLENTKGHRGAAGTITMDLDHITRSIKERMFTYQGGKIVEV